MYSTKQSSLAPAQNMSRANQPMPTPSWPDANAGPTEGTETPALTLPLLRASNRHLEGGHRVLGKINVTHSSHTA